MTSLRKTHLISIADNWVNIHISLFSGKYDQNLRYGGMIGFILDGDSNNIKTEIQKKLNEKFLISPEGDLISTKDNSIEENPFTFDSIHSRKNEIFTIHHLQSVVSTRVSVDKLKGRREKSQAISRKGGRFVIP